MPASKTATLRPRINLGLKERLSTAVQLKHRSIANMVEAARDYCDRNRIAILDKRAVADAAAGIDEQRG